MASVKRAACDRCHGLKMRCIRELERPSCNRCHVADTTCVYSMAKRAGRPSRRPVPELEPAFPQTGDALGDSTTFTSSPDDFLLGFSDSHATPMALDESISAPLSTLSTWGDGPMGSQQDAQDTHALWVTNFMALDALEKSGLYDSNATMETAHSTTAVASLVGNTVQQLSDLSGNLSNHLSSARASKELKTNDSGLHRLETLAAHVVETSTAFHNILSHAGSVLGTVGVASTATTLQILTAYILLIQLHYALYEHIYSVLDSSTSSPSQLASGQSSSSTASPMPGNRPAIPPVFPLLSIGGVSLAPYPRFQLKFILEICVHHLGEVEALLGLPAGFGVTEKRPGSGEAVVDGGIFRADAVRMGLLVRTVMMEAEETVKGIRRVLSDMSEELRGKMQI